VDLAFAGFATSGSGDRTKRHASSSANSSTASSTGAGAGKPQWVEAVRLPRQTVHRPHAESADHRAAVDAQGRQHLPLNTAAMAVAFGIPREVGRGGRDRRRRRGRRRGLT
jgi:hypothetical protein